MNLELFIAKRVSSTSRQSFSGLIIRIAVVAVALSLAVMIVASAVISGFKNQIGEKIFGFWGHIHIAGTQINPTIGESVPVGLNQPFYPSLENLGKITYEDTYVLWGTGLEFPRKKETHGGVRHVQAFALNPGIIKTKKEIEGIILKGVGRDFDSTFLKKYLLRGTGITMPDSAAGNGIILSLQTATRLELDTGQTFIFHYLQNGELYPRKFIVEGIFKTGLEEYDRKFALVDIRKVQQMHGWSADTVGGFEVFIDDLRDLDILTQYIDAEETPRNLSSVNIREKFPAIFEWLALQDINEVVILVLMLIVGLINMVTALMILILERTNMIGTLKALGQTDWGIRKIFLYHAARIILWGLFWGNLAGLGFCWLQQQFGLIQLSEEDYYLSTAPIEFNFLTILLLNVGTLAVILLFLTIPSWLVTRISPVKAIRFK